MAGDPGIGKTRLLGALAELAEERGLLVLAGTAAEFERDIPYSVWAEALDAYVTAQDLTRLPGWDERLGRELGAVLPALGAAGGGEVPEERARAHRALRALLELLAGRRGLVLVLDDLHWCDDASLEALVALLHRGAGDRVLLALGLRPGQAAPRLATALAAAPITRLDLEPLSEADAAALLGGRDTGEQTLLYRHSGGNPFYLEQLARAGSLPPVAGGRLDGAADGVLPPAVAGALAEELGGLAAESRRMLEAAAVTGEPFEPDLAGIVAGLAPEEALDALDDLLARDLVRATSVPARFQFRHPLVRRAVYEGAPGGWRLAAHARAAAALADRGASAAERARHVEQSASRGDGAAIELLLQAGGATLGRSPVAAARWFEAALRLIPADDVAAQVLVRRQLASARRSAGDLEGCRAALLEALDLLPPETGAMQVELVARCAAVEHWLGRHDEAHARLERAWAEVGGDVTREAAVLAVELAVDALYALDTERARARAAGALAAARELGSTPLQAVAAAALALAEAAGGRTADALEHRVEALRALEGLSDAELAPHHEVFYYLGWAENYLEHYDEAIAHADRGIAVARSAGSGRLLVPLMLVKAYPLEMQGRIAEVVELCERALQATELSPNPHFRFWALSEVGWARFYAGDPDGALDACDQAARQEGRVQGATMPAAAGGPGWCQGCALLALGETERAAEVLEAVAGPGLGNLVPAERGFGREEIALAHIALGRLDAAEEHVRAAEELAATLELRLPFALAARARAALQLAAGELADAVASARDAIADAEACGARLQAAYARLLLGQALSAAGERSEAVAELRAAEHELDACGSVRPRDEARRALRKLGARAEPRGPATGADAGVESLTRREREIAELVTDRKTNKQIAAALFLSDKTIESHLRNIFVKLGASSRVDVAFAVDRHRREQSG